MSTKFKRASIVPFDAAGQNAEEAEAIRFDFNPESLTLKVSASRSRDRQRRGRQQVQHVGTSEATLSFEAVFDSSRPRDREDGRAPAATEDELDVRRRTMALAALIEQAENQQGGGSGSGGDKKQPAPKRVQFRWGSIIFNGLITQYQETFDYFSPGGVPLRSKVQITITEQEFRYEVSAAERAVARAAAPPAPAGLRDAAAAAGANSLLDMGPSGLSLGLSPGLSSALNASASAGISLEASLGLSANVGLAVGAGLSLSADASVEVFGSDAIGGGSATAGRASLSAGTTSTSAAAASPWAPDGPAPGTRAAGLAALVNAQRAAGTALAAPNASAAARMANAAGQPSGPLAVRGSPPPLLPRATSGAVSPALRNVPPELTWTGERRPRWETLGAQSWRAAAPSRAAAPHAASAGCGCARCSGGA